MKRKTGKRGLNIYIFFIICPLKSQDLAQSHKNFVRSQDRETVTFRNAGCYGSNIHVFFLKIFMVIDIF